ncbi:SGNH/GDSL hydrolase family protein [Nostocaceae cyanobacterium CENA369]|uniref:SGNH/GDSL hydrolase family protein n=1 Tax=Dendronalium phyllosphericum CENA369 TaxID=1725256 RepID=A0A8J7I518_9NOST|nr:SGNH/GDSL hydrolase family protein [Dendronalium phyllosphericum]MBH8573141.1 SGNH/GDSL hydrolase family protein [Dendronalium phyllosphericum CENA369]
MKQQLMAAGFVLFSFMLPLKALAASLNIDSLYVFGDSLSDTGNVFAASGETFPPAPYYQGRFSNGPIWIEELATKLKLDTPTPYINVVNGATPKNGINFAFGGATTTSINTVSSALPGLQQQIGAFTQPLVQTNQKADSNGLYVLWAGANDYLPTDATNFKPFTDTTQTINNLKTALVSLTNVGAKNILVVNLPNLGLTPRAQNFDANLPVPSGTSPRLSDLTQEHNSDLSKVIEDLDKALAPDVNLISFDVNSVLENVIDEPSKYGFKEVTKPCIFDQSTPSCAIDPSKQKEYLFWDGIHPTAAAHKIIGDRAFEIVEKSAQPVPEPSTALGTLGIGTLGAIAFMKYKRKKLVVTIAGQVPNTPNKTKVGC